MLLVRPRVIGNKGSGFLETKEPRKYPIEFEGPGKDTDAFEITIPPGYVVDDLPPPVDADFSFASYHSKTVVKGSVVDYTRTFEVKELSVPVSEADNLKSFTASLLETNEARLFSSPLHKSLSSSSAPLLLARRSQSH